MFHSLPFANDRMPKGLREMSAWLSSWRRRTVDHAAEVHVCCVIDRVNSRCWFVTLALCCGGFEFLKDLQLDQMSPAEMRKLKAQVPDPSSVCSPTAVVLRVPRRTCTIHWGMVPRRALTEVKIPLQEHLRVVPKQASTSTLCMNHICLSRFGLSGAGGWGSLFFQPAEHRGNHCEI